VQDAVEKKDILDMDALSVEEIQLILDTAENMKEISERPDQKGAGAARQNRHSFLLRAQHAHPLVLRCRRQTAQRRQSFAISADMSSLVKGETLLDTARNLEAMRPDVVVLRHSFSGAPHFLARRLKASVINAGDGTHAHPTQALLDMLTVRQRKGTLEGLKIAIVGDIAHSRVARSNCEGFTQNGRPGGAGRTAHHDAQGIETLGATWPLSVDAAIADADVIMMLRIQKERQKRFSMSTEREYARCFGLNRQRVALAKPDVVVMHPGPMNRGVEIAPDVADGPHSIILDQVTNGVAVRMALLYLVLGGSRNADTD
jgi:aspartate carbamoyltransferase catalytic subunit